MYLVRERALFPQKAFVTHNQEEEEAY